MTIPKITIDQLISEIRRLATENPDHAAVCKYVNINKQPVCIVGVAFYNLGISIDILFSFEDRVVRELIDGLVVHEGVRSFPKEAWCSDVQSHQDLGETWGDSVRKADLNGD